MKVTNATGNYEQQSYVKETVENKKPEAQENQQQTERLAETKKGDTVSLSSASKELQLAKQAVASAPEERSERVEELRQAVSEGTYEIDAEKIADKIIGTNISEFV